MNDPVEICIEGLKTLEKRFANRPSIAYGARMTLALQSVTTFN